MEWQKPQIKSYSEEELVKEPRLRRLADRPTTIRAVMVLTIIGGSTEELDRLWIGFSAMAGRAPPVFPICRYYVSRMNQGITCVRHLDRQAPCKWTAFIFVLILKSELSITSDPGLHFLCFNISQ